MNKPELLNQIEESLNTVRPFLVKDGGNVELVDVSEDWVVSIKLEGSCKSCLMSDMTMKNGIEQSIKKALPQIKSVVEVTE
ncbi:MAG: NifU family protein [Bacteroidetes bacterium]|nr:NifU family protein [Bacteroidota bacterium]